MCSLQRRAGTRMILCLFHPELAFQCGRSSCRQTCSPNGFKCHFKQLRAPLSDPQTIQKPFLLAASNTATRSENPLDAPKRLTHIQVLSFTTIVHSTWSGCHLITLSISLPGCVVLFVNTEYILPIYWRWIGILMKNLFALPSFVLGMMYKGYPSHLFIFMLSVISSQISHHMQADTKSTNIHSRSMSVYYEQASWSMLFVMMSYLFTYRHIF